MANTEEFYWLPEDGMKTENKPSIKTVRFGDGYEQRSPNGLNHSLRVFTCDFRVEANERNSFELFLARHGGYKSFFGARRVLTEKSEWCVERGQRQNISPIPIFHVSLTKW